MAMRAAALCALIAPLSALVFNARVPQVQRVQRSDVSQIVMEGALRSKNLAERRRSKLQTGTNWPPRTDPIPGKGYFFFQGPTPKTAVQEDLPSFFSAANFADLEVNPKQLLVTATGFTAAITLAGLLFAGPIAAPAPSAKPPAVEKKAEKP